MLPSGRRSLQGVLCVWSSHVNTLMPVFAFLWDMLVESGKLEGAQIRSAWDGWPLLKERARGGTEGNSLMRTIIRGRVVGGSFVCALAFFHCYSYFFYPIVGCLHFRLLTFLNKHHDTLADSKYLLWVLTCLCLCVFFALLFFWSWNTNVTFSSLLFFLNLSCCFVERTANRGRKKLFFSSHWKLESMETHQQRRSSDQSHGQKPDFTAIMKDDLHLIFL